jgi:hypothetical protein
LGSPLICRQPNSIKPPAAAAPVDGAVRSPAGAVRGARGAGMATTGELEGDLRYIIPGRFAWCCIPERILARDPEPKIAGARCFCTDSTFVYEQFFADFGPLNLGCVVRYCRATAELLQRCGDEKLVLVHYCSDHRHRRTNAAFLACAFAVVALRWSVRRAYAPFVDCSPPLHPFRDAGFGVCTYQLLLVDVLRGVAKALALGHLDYATFDCDEYDRMERLEHGDLAWIRAAKESDIPNFKGSYLGHFPLVSADFWTSDHLSARSRSVDAFSGTCARGTLTLKRS